MATQSNRAAGWWTSWNHERYLKRLQELRKLHGNSYDLLLFALTQVGAAGAVTLFAVLVYFSTYIADTARHVPFSFNRTVPVDMSFIGGIWSGQITKIFITAALLSSYEKAVPLLENRIAKYSTKPKIDAPVGQP